MGDLRRRRAHRSRAKLDQTRQADARALATLPLEHGDVWQVQGIVNDYVIGYSFRTVGTVSPEDMEAAIAPSDVVEFPELTALPDNLRTRSSIERFELGLQAVLDGIEQRFLDAGDAQS